MSSTRAGHLAAQLLVGAFVGLFGTYLLNTVDGFRVPTQLLFVLPLVAWGALRLRGPWDALDWAVLAAVTAHLLVAASGVDPTGSLQATGLALSFALLFWLMRRLENSSPGLRAVIVLAALVPTVIWLAAVAVAWLMEKVAWVQAGGGIPALESYQVFVWGTANAFPILVLLAAPLVAFLTPGRRRRAFAIALGLPAVVVVPLSVGRAGWLGLAVGLVAFEALSGWAFARAAVARIRRSRAMVWGAVIGGLVLTGLALGSGRIGAAVTANLDSRSRIWSQALGVFGADPLTGSGPGTFSWMRLEHVPDYADPIGVILAHNAWLQTLSDGGLLLAAAFGAAVVLWTSTVWRSRRVLTGAQRAAAAAVVGLGAASLLDDFSFLPALMAVAVTLAAWSAPAPEREVVAVEERLRWVLPAGAALIGALVLLPAISVERARTAAAEGRQAAVEGRWPDAADRFAAAAEAHPTNPLDHLGLGFALAEASDVDAARVAYEKADGLSPGDPRVDGALAALAAERGDLDLEATLLDAASRVSTDPQYAYRLARALVGSGDFAAGAQAYALGVTLRTDLYALLASNAYGLGRADVRAALLEVAARLEAVDPERLPPVLWDVSLIDGDLSTDAPAAWQAIGAAIEGRMDEAARRVDEARREAPHAQTTHLAAAWVARLACDQDGYERAIRLAGRVFGGSVPDLAIGRDPIYRELGLGDYQPSWVERPPDAKPWPQGLVDAPKCAWTR